MKSAFELTDELWDRIKPLISVPARKAGRPRINDRIVLSAILLVLIDGIQWKDIPKKYGRWETINSRFYKWCNDGTMKNILLELKPELSTADLNFSKSKYLYYAGILDGNYTIREEMDRFRPTGCF